MFSSLEMPHSVLMLLLMCCASVHYYAMYSPDANAAVHCFCTIFFLMLLQIVMQFHRVKVHFSRKYIRRHHLFVLYKYEAGVTLESIVAHQSLVEDVTPNAQKPGCTSVFTRASLLVREIAAASVKLVSVIHDCGYSLDGRLTFSNLFWIPATKSLKVGALEV